MPNTYSPLRYPGGKTKFYGYVRDILEATICWEKHTLSHSLRSRFGIKVAS